MAMTLLPSESVSLNTSTQTSYNETQPSKTYKINFETKRVAGYCDELEAMEQAIYKYLQTERYAYPIYNSDYGNELKTLIGKSMKYAESETKRIIKETLSVDERIQRVFDFVFTKKHDSMFVSFFCETVFGQISIKDVKEWQT